MIVLDSDLLIAFGKGDKNAIAKVEALLQKNVPIGITAINYAEVLFGFKEGSKKQELEKSFLDSLHFFELGIKEINEVLKIQIYLSKKGKRLNILDEYIAGICVANNISIVTRNIKHFILVKGLKVEKW